MLRFVVVGVVTVTLSLAGAAFGLLTVGDPPVPHVRLADRASTTAAETPGSNLEGITRALGPAMAYVGMIETALAVQAAEAVARQAEQDAVAAAQPPALSGPAATADYEDPSGWTEWDWQAECETGGDWSMQGSTFSGGLGFANSSWSAFGGEEFAPNAGMATREQQITVAERIQGSPPVNSPGDACTGWLDGELAMWIETIDVD